MFLPERDGRTLIEILNSPPVASRATRTLIHPQARAKRAGDDEFLPPNAGPGNHLVGFFAARGFIAPPSLPSAYNRS